MKQSTNVSVNRGLHNRDISKIRKNYRLFYRITSPNGDVRIVESFLTEFKAQPLSEIFDEVILQLNNIACSTMAFVAFSRFHCSRYISRKPIIKDFLSNLSYLRSSYSLNDDEFVIAYCSPKGNVAQSRVDFVVKFAQSSELCK